MCRFVHLRAWKSLASSNVTNGTTGRVNALLVKSLRSILSHAKKTVRKLAEKMQMEKKILPAKPKQLLNAKRNVFFLKKLYTHDLLH